MELETLDKLRRARIQIQKSNPFFAYLSLYLKFRESKEEEIPKYAGMGVSADGWLIYKKEFVDCFDIAFTLSDVVNKKDPEEFEIDTNKQEVYEVMGRITYICKKMIINAGLNRIIVSSEGAEKYQIFSTHDWITEWQANDIIDDRYKSGQKQS